MALFKYLSSIGSDIPSESRSKVTSSTTPEASDLSRGSGMRRGEYEKAQQADKLEIGR